jgi:hypothetical protein
MSKGNPFLYFFISFLQEHPRRAIIPSFGRMRRGLGSLSGGFARHLLGFGLS